MRSVLLGGLQRARASVTFNNINLSQDLGVSSGSAVSSGNRFIELSGGQWATYEVLYRTQPYIRAAVNRLAMGIGRIPLNVYTEAPLEADSELVERRRVRTGPLAELMRNPWGNKAASHLKQSALMNVLKHGFSIHVKVRLDPNLPPRYLMPTSPAQWYIPNWAYDEWDQPTVYVYRVPYGTVGAAFPEIPFYPDEIWEYAPYSAGRGFAPSPLEALRRTLLSEDAVQRAAIAAFEHGMKPAGFISYEGEMTPTTMMATREKIDEKYGGVDNYFRSLVLDQGAKWFNIDAVVVDPELMKLRLFNREEVATVYNIPQPALGILDKEKTAADAVQKHLAEYQDTWQPWTTMFEETWQVQVVDPEPAFAGQYVEFNYKEILKGDPVREQETLTKVGGRPFMTLNEVRGTQNLRPFTPDEDPTADKVPLQLNSATAGAALGGDNGGPGGDGGGPN